VHGVSYARRRAAAAVEGDIPSAFFDAHEIIISAQQAALIAARCRKPGNNVQYRTGMAGTARNRAQPATRQNRVVTPIVATTCWSVLEDEAPAIAATAA